MRHSFRSALLGGAAACAMAGGAQAADYSGLVVFGDSLVDTGQFLDPLLGLPDTAAAAGVTLPKDARLRFTNRGADGQYMQPYSQQLANILGFGVLSPSQPQQPGAILNLNTRTTAVVGPFTSATGLNYAVGGQTSAEILSSITDAGGAQTRGDVGGMRDLTGQFINVAQDGFLVGAQAAKAPGALALISSGGNDVRALANVSADPTGITGVTLVTDRTVSAATMATAAQQAVAGAKALSDAGVKLVILPNLPDIGAVPENGFDTLLASTPIFRTGVSAADAALLDQIKADPTLISTIRANGTTDFNAALSAAAAASGANIMQFDLAALFAAAVADPTKFGFVDPAAIGHAGAKISDLCYNDEEVTMISCQEANVVGFGNATRNPYSLLFNDGIHPTVAGHAMIAQAIAAQLKAAETAPAAPTVALSAARGFAAALDDAGRGGAPVGALRGFAAIGAGAGEIANIAGGKADTTVLSAAAGLRYGAAEGVTVGAGVGYGQIDAKTGGGGFSAKGDAFMGGVFAQLDQGAVFGGLSLSGGALRFDSIERQSKIGAATMVNSGAPNGSIFAADAAFGYRAISNETATFGPILRADYVNATVSGYTEGGDASTALRFGEVTARSAQAGAGLFLEANGGGTATPVVFRAEALYMAELAGDGDAFTVGAAGLAGDASFDGRKAAGAGLRLGLNLGAELGFGRVSLGYTLNYGDDISHGARAQISIPF